MLIQALLLAFLTWTGHIQIWHVYLLSLLLGSVNAVDVPARQAFTVDMVEGKEDLTNAIGLNSTIFNLARALGPALAGLCVAATGEAVAFLLNGVTFVAVIFSLLAMRNLPKPVRPKETGGKLSYLVEGYKFAIKQQVILVLFSVVGLSAFLSMPYSTLMPIFANEVLNNSAQPVVNFMCSNIRCIAPEALPLGILLTMVGIGAVAGSLWVASLPRTASRGRWLTIGTLIFPSALLGFSISRSFLLSLVFLVIAGFSFVFQNTLANTMIQLLAPDELRGRVMSIYSLVTQGMTRLGGLQAGFMADWMGAPFTVGIGTAISLVFGAFIALRYPNVRKS